MKIWTVFVMKKLKHNVAIKHQGTSLATSRSQTPVTEKLELVNYNTCILFPN